MVDQPATSSVIAVLCCIWLLIKSRRLGYGDVGLSYDKAVQNKEVWRVITSQLSHIDLLHLLFNVSSAWSLRSAEAQGILYYVHTSLLLMLLSAAVLPSLASPEIIIGAAKLSACTMSFSMLLQTLLPDESTCYQLRYRAMQVYCGALYVLIFVAQQEQYRHVTVVGYSCVVFGWMTLLLVSKPLKCMICGIDKYPLVTAASGLANSIEV